MRLLPISPPSFLSFHLHEDLKKTFKISDMCSCSYFEKHLALPGKGEAVPVPQFSSLFHMQTLGTHMPTYTRGRDTHLHHSLADESPRSGRPQRPLTE